MSEICKNKSGVHTIRESSRVNFTKYTTSKWSHEIINDNWRWDKEREEERYDFNIRALCIVIQERIRMRG